MTAMTATRPKPVRQRLASYPIPRPMPSVRIGDWSIMEVLRDRPDDAYVGGIENQLKIYSKIWLGDPWVCPASGEIVGSEPDGMYLANRVLHGLNRPLLPRFSTTHISNRLKYLKEVGLVRSVVDYTLTARDNSERALVCYRLTPLGMGAFIWRPDLRSWLHKEELEEYTRMAYASVHNVPLERLKKHRLYEVPANWYDAP